MLISITAVQAQGNGALGSSFIFQAGQDLVRSGCWSLAHSKSMIKMPQEIAILLYITTV